MAKDLPYFKFIATEWLTGNICYEPFELQGLFINICALYWNRGGILSISEIEQRYKKKHLIAKLSDRFFSLSDGFINIEFLDEQLAERQYVSKKNSENGKKGGRPTNEEKKANANQLESDLKAKKSNIEEEQEEEKNKKRKEEEQELELWPTFNDFWELYDKKIGEKGKIKSKWEKLKYDDKCRIMHYIPDYKLSQPDKQFRKHPETFLNNKSWNDEIINANGTKQNTNSETISKWANHFAKRTGSSN